MFIEKIKMFEIGGWIPPFTKCQVIQSQGQVHVDLPSGIKGLMENIFVNLGKVFGLILVWWKSRSSRDKYHGENQAVHSSHKQKKSMNGGRGGRRFEHEGSLASYKQGQSHLSSAVSYFCYWNAQYAHLSQLGLVIDRWNSFLIQLYVK